MRPPHAHLRFSASTAPVLGPALLAALFTLALPVILTAALPPTISQIYLVCRTSNSAVCTAWPIHNQDSYILQTYPKGQLKRICGFSNLKKISPHRKFFKVKLQKEYESGTMLCNIDMLLFKKVLTVHTVNLYDKALDRKPRAAGYGPRGRYRGQTQSQYLSIDRGNDKDEGKAEAHSDADSSRASVSGTSGMGQAQSQSMYDPSCDECLGRSEIDADNLKLKPSDDSTTSSDNNRPRPGIHSATGSESNWLPGTTIPRDNGLVGIPGGNIGGYQNQGSTPSATDTTGSRVIPGGNVDVIKSQGGNYGGTVPNQGRTSGEQTLVNPNVISNPDIGVNPNPTFVSQRGGIPGVNTGVYPNQAGQDGSKNVNLREHVDSYSNQGGKFGLQPNQGGTLGGGNSPYLGVNGKTHLAPNSGGSPNGYPIQGGSNFPNQERIANHNVGQSPIGNLSPNQGGSISDPNRHLYPNQGTTSGSNGFPGSGSYNQGSGIGNYPNSEKNVGFPNQDNNVGFLYDRVTPGTNGSPILPTQGNWPITSGSYVGPNGLTYYCCVVAPNQQPTQTQLIPGQQAGQSPSVQNGPGINLPTGGQFGLGQFPSGTIVPVHSGTTIPAPGLHEPVRPGGTVFSQVPGQYGPGQFPGGQHVSGQSPGGQYGRGSSPTGTYVPGQSPAGTYEPGQSPGGQDGPGQSPGGQYMPGQSPRGTYGPGPSPGGQYGTGKSPEGTYGPEQSPGGQYIPGQSPGGRYGPGQSPGEQYGPGQTLGAQYLPGQSPGGTYGPGQTLGGQYLHGQSPGGTYGPGQSAGGTYSPGQSPGGQYMTGQSSGGTYGPGQPPGGTYGPEQSPGRQYMPGKSPDRTYGPGQSPGATYGPGQSPGGQYMPGQSPGGTYGSGQSPGGTYGAGQSPGGTYEPVQSLGGQYRPGQSPGGPYAPGQPAAGTYGPGPSPGGQYGPGQPPAGTYGPESPPGEQYGPGQSPGGTYAPGQSLSGTNGPGQSPGVQYTPGQSSGGQYIPGQSPGGQYVPVQTPIGTPGPGQSPGVQYGPGQSPGGQYGPGQSPGGQYGPGLSPGGQYGPGQSPGGQYAPGQPAVGTYGPGQSPGGQYRPGQSPGGPYAPGQPAAGTYGPGQSPGGQYGSGQSPGGQFGPGQLPGGPYGPGQYPGGTYGPGQSPGGQYGLGQSPDGTYGPGPSPGGQYGPGLSPGGQYIPGQYGTGESGTQYVPGVGSPGSQIAPTTGIQPTNTDLVIGSGHEPWGTGTSNQNGIPQNVRDPNSIAATLDDYDSNAEATVAQNTNGTIASASSRGGNDKGRAQTNVQGTYTGSGSFSAQAEISDENKAAHSQVEGSKKGAKSSAQGRGQNNLSQASVQLGSETGSLQTAAETKGSLHSSNSKVQGSVKGGMADAQAKGPGSTSSQAQIGFTPYKQGDKAHDKMKTPFVGQGTASAQSSGRSGQSQSSLGGTFKYGISYSGAAQSGSSLDKDAVFPNRLPYNNLDVYDESNKNINVETEGPLDTEVTTEKDPTLDNQTESYLNDSASQQSSHTHFDHHKSDNDIQTPSKGVAVGTRRSFEPTFGSNGGEFEYTTGKDDATADDYYPDGGFGPDNPEVEPNEYSNYDEYTKDVDGTHQSLQTENKGLEIKQNTGGNTQHIVLGSLDKQDAEITQQISENPDESRIYQPGERVPGTGGYTIPIGFTGSVKSVASKDKTYAVGYKDSPSQAQTVALSPGSGKVRYVYPSAYGRNVKPKDLRSLYHAKPDDSNRYMSVSKSVTKDLDSENNIRKQYSHTYYTKSSSCGYFTFTCTMVSGADGRKKVCKPKIPTNPDGSPMKC